MIPVALCIPFPLSASYDDMLAMHVYATFWLSMHLYTLTYMFMHESCLLVCRPYFNTMKLWTFDPNLHLSLVDTTFYLFAYLFACFLALSAFLFVYLSYCLSCLLPPAMLAMSITLICFMHLSYTLCIFFLPLLVCWFLVFAFACTQME